MTATALLSADTIYFLHAFNLKTVWHLQEDVLGHKLVDHHDSTT